MYNNFVTIKQIAFKWYKFIIRNLHYWYNSFIIKSLMLYDNNSNNKVLMITMKFLETNEFFWHRMLHWRCRFQFHHNRNLMQNWKQVLERIDLWYLHTCRASNIIFKLIVLHCNFELPTYICIMIVSV